MPTQRNQQRQPEPEPVDPEASLNSFFPDRFMKPYHLTDAGKSQVTLTIARITKETVGPPDRQEEALILYFADQGEKPYLFKTKADKDTLANVYGIHKAGQLVGARITIHIATWNKEPVLRIKPVRPQAQTPAPVSTEPPVYVTEEQRATLTELYRVAYVELWEEKRDAIEGAVHRNKKTVGAPELTVEEYAEILARMEDRIASMAHEEPPF